MTGIRTTPAPAVRLAVDWTRCDGHGLCAELADGAISLDDWGYPILPIHGTEQNKDTQMDERTMRRIVAFCPALALRLEHARRDHGGGTR